MSVEVNLNFFKIKNCMTVNREIQKKAASMKKEPWTQLGRGAQNQIQ